MTILDDAPVYEPFAVQAEYPPPRANVDPDRTKGGLRRLWPIVRAYRSDLVITIVASAISMGIMVLVPRLTQHVVDDVIIRRQGSIRFWAILLLSLATIRYFFNAISRFRMQKMGFSIQYELRNLMYEHFNRMSFRFYDHAQTGQLVSRANSDIRAVEMFLAFGPMMIVVVGQFFLALGFMLSMHVGLTLIVLAPLIFIYFIGVRMRQQMFPMSWIMMSRAADVSTIVEENVTGTRVVKSFAAERDEINRLAKASGRLRWAGVKQIDIQAKFSPLLQNLPRVGQLAVILYGGWLAIHGQIGVGTLVAFNAYIIQLAMPFMMFGMMLMMAQRASASSSRILEVLDEQPDIVDAPGAHDIARVRGDVEFDDVTFGYGEGSPILRNFSVRLNAGETVAMVGRTGCGKSTVARLIPRYYDVDDGAVRLDGIDVREITLRALRANVGLVLDEPFLFSTSIRENIAYGRPEADMDDIIRVAKLAGAHEFIEHLPEGYETVLGEHGYTLSGGQRQRIAIARTLLVNPPVLVLDDATSSVDVQVEQQIHDALRELMTGRTTLIIAHRLSTIALADRVLLMDDGKVVADGTHLELLQTVPLYGEVLSRSEQEYELAHEERVEKEAKEVERRRRFAEMQRRGGDRQGMPGADMPLPDGAGPMPGIGG